MPATALPVLWICGPSGVGKSSVGWALFERMGDEGVSAAYVDIDQLGMLYPEGDDDPERYDLKSAALAALLPNYAAAGADVVVVSGVVDPRAGAAPSYAGVDLTCCLLTVDEVTLRGRIRERGWDAEEAEEVVAEASALCDAPFVDVVVDTTGLHVAEVVDRVRRLVSTRGSSDCAGAPSPVSSSADAPVLVVCGPRAAGSSTVSFHLAMTRWREGSLTGFVDLQQLAFLVGPGGTVSDTALGLANLATMHELFGSRDSTALIVSAHLGATSDHDRLRSSLPGSTVRVVRLRVDQDALAGHLVERSRGSLARLAGDDLLGSPADVLEAVLVAALAEQDALAAAAAEDLVVDVGVEPVTETAPRIRAWLGDPSTWSQCPAWVAVSVRWSADASLASSA